MGHQRNFLIFLSIFCFLVNLNLAEQRYKAFAAPTGPNAIEIEGSNKPFFKTAPTKDGIIHAIADEVQPGVVLQFQPEQINDFPAYDDNFVEPNKENEVYIPPFFRNETEKEKEEKKTPTQPPTTTTRRPAPRVQTQRTTLPPPVFIPTRASPPPSRQPLPVVQPQTLAPVRQPQPRPTIPPPRPLPPVQQQPQQSFVPRLVPAPPPQRPVQQPLPQRPLQQTFQPPPQQFRPPPPPPQTRPPPPPPVFRPTAPQPTPQPFRPTPPSQPQTFRPAPPPQQFRPAPPPPPPQQFRPPPPPPQQFRPAPPPPQQPRPAPPPQQFRPQPQFGRQPPPQLNNIRPTVPPRALRPFQPNQQRPPTSGNRPRTSNDGLRAGTCPFTIFYQSSPASSFEAQQTYTHFAAVVSVDQCARTCHEFQCTFAFFDPVNRHCQFTPGNGVRESTCPSYPNPLLRNNVPLSAVPLRISCIVCQRRRRTNRNRGRFFTSGFGQNRRQFQPQVIGRSVANVLHGVVLRQPQSVAINVNNPILRNETLSHEETTSLEVISGENPPKEEQIVPAGWIPLNMHKLSSAEASEESKERLSKFSSKEFIDNSTEKDETDVRISQDEQLIKKIPENSQKQRIIAAEKLLESNEFA